MSPVSRARKKSSQPASPSVNGLFKDVLRDFSAVAAEPGPFDVELLASEVIGQWAEADPEDRLGLELIAFAQRKITPGAAALLAALKVLAETGEERAAAAEALAVVLGRGIPEPEWAGEIGQVTVGECWRTGDVYGDESSLLCVFSRGEATLGLLALLDFTEGGRVRDLVVIEEPHEVLAEMRGQAEEDRDLVVLDKVEPADAHRLLAEGIAATDALSEPEVGEDYARFHAVALTWCRCLPEPSATEAVAAWSPVRRTEAVDRFLAESNLSDPESGREIARLLVEHGCRTEPADPLRVGPEKLARFLESLLDGETELEDEDAVAPVVLAWAAWGARRAELSDAAAAALVEDVTEYLAEYLADDEDDEDFSDYLDGTESAEEVLAVVARRRFAVPETAAVIGDEELTDLDPGDPEQRRLLVIGAHPEYHESLAAEEFDGTDGLRLALETSVVDHLWDDEPPEVWEAAQRLTARGLAREAVLDQLVTVLESQLTETEEEDRLDYDLDGYREALREA
ncbi:hypothetical protein [Amycolatopsis jiangsuensis]|uniref:DUF1841 family protein n=1 Tax=Amycolatopsis jiangsuensis TaxID=1181879 RepID=A0A840IWB2_9PSEU|nr:hypothetical protein [Amycolatopsis jiangsuensis]MBB4687051.1 hypothetical protein [Amycolatopsis jiangsuensis]